MRLNKLEIVTDGIVKNNPTFRLVLGTCPTLAVTTSAYNGLSMGLATAFTLICSNILISLLRNIIPDKVRIPAYIMIISTFVTIVQMVTAAYLPEINDSLGIFIPLIVVNCIILARAESFANQNKVLDSALDGLGIGIGFTLALGLIGLVREFLGSASLTIGDITYTIKALEDASMTIFILPAGGFFIFGLMMVLFNTVMKKIENRKGKTAGGNK